MGPAPVCNTTLEDNRSKCFPCKVWSAVSKKVQVSELPIHGTLTFHRIALICVGVLTTISLGLSAWLMFQHATHYSKPWEQKQILRILSIVPVYGVTSLLIVGFYQNYVYFTIISQLYEPLAVVSYLTLICHLVAGSMKELDIWLRTKEAKPWIFPLNLFAKCTGGQRSPFRTPRTAMTQFNVRVLDLFKWFLANQQIIWFCVYQYCVVRLVTTIAGLIAQATDRYCQTSLNPQYAHLWVRLTPDKPFPYIQDELMIIAGHHSCVVDRRCDALSNPSSFHCPPQAEAAQRYNETIVYQACGLFDLLARGEYWLEWSRTHTNLL